MRCHRCWPVWSLCTSATASLLRTLANSWPTLRSRCQSSRLDMHQSCSFASGRRDMRCRRCLPVCRQCTFATASLLRTLANSWPTLRIRCQSNPQGSLADYSSRFRRRDMRCRRCLPVCRHCKVWSASRCCRNPLCSCPSLRSYRSSQPDKPACCRTEIARTGMCPSYRRCLPVW